MVTPFIMLAAIVKAVTDGAKAQFGWSGPVVQLGSAVIGIAVASLTGLDATAEIVETSGDWPEFLRIGVTGIALGLGSNFIHDLVKAIRG